jgi:hypothetical protein
MLKPSDPNYVRPFPQDLESLQYIGNAKWHDWHGHLYTCKVCQKTPKCSMGQSLFDAANAQRKEDA